MDTPAGKTPRKICFPITSRASYGRQKLLLQKLQQDPRVNLELILAGSVLLEKYSQQVPEDIARSGFTVAEMLLNVIDGGNHVAMAKTACITALECVNSFQKMNPDIIVITGDRYEQLAIAMAGAYLNKTIAHIEGGDVTGSIDESVRHAITKLAHLHFVTNDASHRRVVQMGEQPEHVWNVGSFDIEAIEAMNGSISPETLNRHGVGEAIDTEKPFLTVIVHPVTSESDLITHTNAIFRAVVETGLPTVWFWPNADAGTTNITEAIRHFREQQMAAKRNFRFITNMPQEEFIGLIRRTACLVGNSSSGIKECSFLGTPVVNIGTRQHRRLRGPNVIDVGYDAAEIRDAIRSQMVHGKYPQSRIYHKPDTSKRIAEILATAPLYTQKIFHEHA